MTQGEGNFGEAYDMWMWVRRKRREDMRNGLLHSTNATERMPYIYFLRGRDDDNKQYCAVDEVAKWTKDNKSRKWGKAIK
jgi:hypothetical protein